MSTQEFFATMDQSEETVFAALEYEIRAAAMKARIRALNEMAPLLRGSEDDQQRLLRKLEDAQ